MIKTLDRPEDYKIITNRPLRPWQIIIVHHTATDADILKHYGTIIDKFHRDDRGWDNGMGYHFLISPDGTIEVGDRWIFQLDGAHCPGFNDIAIGVAFVGNFDNGVNHPTMEQIHSWWALRKALGNKPTYPHCAFRATACPGAYFTEDLKVWCQLIDKFEKEE